MASRVYEYHNQLPSTHEYAIHLLSNSKPKVETVIVAGHQTMGRGQYDRSWNSEPDQNLLLSAITFPNNLSVDFIFILHITASLAIVDFIEQQKITSAHIKWPNDILIENKKIAGILIQNQISGHYISSSVISVGININQKAWPSDIQATSLFNLSGENYEIKEAASVFTDLLFKKMARIKDVDSWYDMKKKYLTLLHGHDTPITFELRNTNKIYGKIIDVFWNGNIVVESDYIHSVFSQDQISIIRDF